MEFLQGAFEKQFCEKKKSNCVSTKRDNGFKRVG